jgi:cytochrome P450
MDRVAVRNTFLPRGGGADGKSPVIVPKGTTVGAVAWAMHRNASLWGPDVLEFKPERWERESKTSGKWIAFGGGPRVCPGRESSLTLRLFRIFADKLVYRKSGID